ncbi:transposase [Puniceicoccus vermicola]|uniref:Transposase n=1 Tax=Puniceicoccus vermicola TaxID=388746 RepID=A0A7X1B1Q5_9BACT|nr:transposase [Puniceicoccus vermicola]MBC2603917.1 transposase [Puniceicoccus vermicola]
MDSTQTVTYIGVDISKETLEVCLPSGKRRFPFTPSGMTSLRKAFPKEGIPHVICEATGGYEKALLEDLWEHGIAVSLVNASRVRHFAKSEGLKAKSDPIDAHILARFGEEKKPRRCDPPTPVRKKMIELLDRRAQLSDMITQEKNRTQKAPASLRKSYLRVLKTLEQELNTTDRELEKCVGSDETLKRNDELFCSVKGIGSVTSWSILAYLGDITQFGRNQLVALVGVAPFDQDSGTHKGRRRIEGGRAKVRRALYMAAQSAAAHNPVIKPYVARLKERQKPHKVALTAAMRKIIIHLHSIAKNQELSLA